MRANEIITEKWSAKYKRSINCSHPRGFSQRAHCAGKKKHTESHEVMEQVCPDCGMCQTHGNVMEIRKGQKDANGYTRCWPGKHAEGTKQGKNGPVRNCEPNESQGVAEGAGNNLQTIIKSFVDSPSGQKYKKYDCKTITRVFVQWAEQNKIPAQVISLAPPSAEFIKKNPQFKGKSGQGDGHIMPVVDGNAIDFTVRQFGITKSFENPLVTPTNSLPAVYGRFGYFTDKPEWFLGGKSYWMGPLSSIPNKIFNQNFSDEMLEQGVAEGEGGLGQTAGIGINGKQFNFSIKDLIAKAQNYPEKKLNPQLFVKQLADRHEDPKQTAARAQAADLQYPIIVVQDGNTLMIADGTHRAQKAIMNKLPSINARVIPVKDMDEFSQQGVAEGSENNNPIANKIFFARSNKTPKGWSYDHVGFITQDGKQIQMSGHKGNDVYVTNDVTDDPEFPKQNIKIVSLSKPVLVPTTNTVGAENCGTFVANVLQTNGIKGIDTQKIYSVFKKPHQQGVAEELNEEFDLIESIIEDIAAQNGVDAEAVWEDLESLTEDELYAFAVTSQLNEDWQKANKQDRTAGMSQKAVNAYRRENPGSKLKTAVTTKPSKLKRGSKASKRRKSYCSRSRGQMKMHNISCAKTPDKAICKARRRWNC